MRTTTVQELIDDLSSIEDRDRKVVVAGAQLGPLRILGRFGSGHVIIWDAERCDAAEERAGLKFY